MSENALLNIVWEDKFKSSSEYRALDTIDGEPLEFEWNIYPGFTTLQFSVKNERRTRKIHWTDHLHVGCSTTSHGDPKTRKNANQAPKSFRLMREDFQQEDGHSSDLEQKRSGIPLMKAKPESQS